VVEGKLMLLETATRLTSVDLGCDVQLFEPSSKGDVAVLANGDQLCK
jgi:hypothetical protein